MVDQDVVLPSEKRKMKGDEDFDLVVEETDYAEGVINKCYFCARKDPPILGPFIRVNNVNRSKPNEKYYFHKDCIEVNNYSFFSTAKQKWLNIGKAIE